jgi:hypothetical protein
MRGSSAKQDAVGQDSNKKATKSKKETAEELSKDILMS